MKQASFQLNIAELLPSCSLPGIKHCAADNFSGLWSAFDVACESGLEFSPINGLCSLLFVVAGSICSACAHLLHRNELDECCAQNLMISIRTDEGGHGRNTLVNTTLKVFDKAGGILQERELETAEDLRAALESYFGIVPLTS